MSADLHLIRTASKRIREVATHRSVPMGAWFVQDDGFDFNVLCPDHETPKLPTRDVARNLPDDSDSDSSPVGIHTALWSPPVALAVADWLDAAGADLWAHGPLCECGSGCHICDDSLWQPHVRRALAVARLIVGDGVTQ